MTQLKKMFKNLILIIVLVSIMIMFIATPSSYAKLTIEEGEFYYAGTTKGTYVVREGIFEWLVESIGQIGDWLLGIMTMGFRMVFVGWTALVEHLLTWGLETASGINLDGEEISSTDLSKLSDSSNNVTVQAIVYNMVPALNVNFFKLDYEHSYMDGDDIYSATGHKLICDKCRKSVKLCCSNGLPDDHKEIDVEKGNYCVEECGCNGECEACKEYRQILNPETDPIIIQIKNMIAVWYNILRVLATAAMLILLIGIGIKMAISTIAEEKAVYKRMFFDWLVGLVILFGIHYLMYAAISVNETAIGVIKDAADEVNEVKVKHLIEEDSDEINDLGITKLTDQELEVNVYETIRTRAYDAKLTVGLPGMIMYMSLVYFAIKYTFMYVRRFFTLAILTLMGPVIGVAYAFQKAFYGNSPSYKKWLTDYLLTLFIQIVHALLYAIFISDALILSLESISGTVIALLFMNIAFNSESLFKKIFNFNASGSLKKIDESANLKNKLDTLQNFAVGGKSTYDALLNTPYTKTAKAIGKMAVAGAGLGITQVPKVVKKGEDVAKQGINKATTKVKGFLDNNGIQSTKIDSVKEKYSDFKTSLQNKREQNEINQELEDQDILNTGSEELRDQAINAYVMLNQDPTDENKENALNAQRRFNRYRELKNKQSQKFVTEEVSTKDILRSKINDYMNVDKYIILKRKNSDGKNVFVFKKKSYSKNSTRRGKVTQPVSNFIETINGTKTYNPITGRMEYNKDGLYSQLNPSKLLGLTDADKKVLKEHFINPMRNGLIGIASVFVGMGTFVDNPQLGMAMMAGGKIAARDTIKKFGLTNASKKYYGKYKFSRFSVGAIRNINKNMMERLQYDRDRLMIQNVKLTHRKLYDYLTGRLSGMKPPKTLKLVVGSEEAKKLNLPSMLVKVAPTAIGTAIGGLGFGVAIGAGVHGVKAARRQQILSSYLNSDNKHLEQDEDNEYFKNKKYMTGFERTTNFVNEKMHGNFVSVKMYAKRDAVMQGASMTALIEHHNKQLKQQQQEIDKETLDLMAITTRLDMKDNLYRYLVSLEVDTYKSLGYDYDPKTGKIQQREEQNSNSQNSTYMPARENQVIKADEIVTELNGNKITNQDIKLMDKKIDQILMDISKGDAIDINDEKTMNLVIEQLSDELVESKIILADQVADLLFVDGKEALKEKIKDKAVYANDKILAVNESLDELSNTEKYIVKKSIEETINEMFDDSMENQKNDTKVDRYENIDTAAVLEKIRESVQRGEIRVSDEKERQFVPNFKDNGLNRNNNQNSNIDMSDISYAFKEKTQKYLESMKELTNPQSVASVHEKNRFIDSLSESDRIILDTAVESVIESNMKSVAKKQATIKNIKSENIMKKITEKMLKDNVDVSVTDEEIKNSVEEKYKNAVEQYLNGMQKARESLAGNRNSELDIKIEERKRIKQEKDKDKAKKIIEKKKDKITEMLEQVYLGDDDNLVEEVKTDNTSTDEEKQKLLKALFAFKELKERSMAINEYATEHELAKRGAGAYNKALLKKSELKLEYLRDFTKVEDYQLKNGAIDQINESMLTSDEKIKYRQMKSVQSKLNDKKIAYEKAENEVKRVGPIMNLRTELKNLKI